MTMGNKKLGLTTPTITNTNNITNNTIVRAMVNVKGIHHDATAIPYDGIHNGINNDNIRVIRTGKQFNLNPGYILSSNQTKYLVKSENLQRLSHLRSHGVYFLYGMLFESLFTLSPTLDPPLQLLHPNIKNKKVKLLHFIRGTLCIENLTLGVNKITFNSRISPLTTLTSRVIFISCPINPKRFNYCTSMYKKIRIVPVLLDLLGETQIILQVVLAFEQDMAHVLVEDIGKI